MIDEYGKCDGAGLVHICKTRNRAHINLLWVIDLKFGTWKTKLTERRKGDET